MRKWLIAVVGVLLLAGCSSKFGHVEKPVADGDVQIGHDAIMRYGCGVCHHIPGVDGADTFVGPPLNHFAQRHYIAGKLPNTADNLIYWIQFPQLVEPGTAMPNMNVSEADARHIAAYLYSR